MDAEPRTYTRRQMMQAYDNGLIDGQKLAMEVAAAPAVTETDLRAAARLALDCLDVMVDRQTLTGASRARDALRAALAEEKP